jgi:hypothetical protein
LLQRAFLLRALLEYHSRVHATADDEFVSCPQDLIEQLCSFYFEDSIKIGLPPRIPTPGSR